MHDLNTLSRLNAEAYADAIANLRSQGRDVVATYSGATLMAIESFSLPAQAAAALAAPTASPDEHRKLFAGFHPAGQAIQWPPLEPNDEDGLAAQNDPECALRIFVGPAMRQNELFELLNRINGHAG